LQEDTCKGVLCLMRQGADSFNCAFEQFGHVRRIRSSREKRKQKPSFILPL
jgi:hypothetical protein